MLDVAAVTIRYADRSSTFTKFPPMNTDAPVTEAFETVFNVPVVMLVLNLRVDSMMLLTESG